MLPWIKRWGPAILMMLLIFFASATPSRDMPSFGVLDLLVKKGGHMFGYALLAIAYLRGLTNGKGIKMRHLVLAVLLAGLYAASDEFHQTFTSGRNPSSGDVLIDTTGAILGLLIWSRIRILLTGNRGSAQA